MPETFSPAPESPDTAVNTSAPPNPGTHSRKAGKSAGPSAGGAEAQPVPDAKGPMHVKLSDEGMQALADYGALLTKKSPDRKYLSTLDDAEKFLKMLVADRYISFDRITRETDSRGEPGTLVTSFSEDGITDIHNTALAALDKLKRAYPPKYPAPEASSPQSTNAQDTGKTSTELKPEKAEPQKATPSTPEPNRAGETEPSATGATSATGDMISDILTSTKESKISTQDAYEAAGIFRGASPEARAQHKEAVQRAAAEDRLNHPEEFSQAELQERALAENVHMSFAAAQLKNNQIDAARRSVEAAHAKSELVESANNERVELAHKSSKLLNEKIQSAVANHEYQNLPVYDRNNQAADQILRKEIGERIGRSENPSAVIKYDDKKTGLHYTDVVFEASASRNIAFVERFSLDGQLISRHVVTTKEPAFTIGRKTGIGSEVQRVINKLPAGKLPEARDFSDVKLTVQAERKLGANRSLKRTGERLRLAGKKLRHASAQALRRSRQYLDGKPADAWVSEPTKMSERTVTSYSNDRPVTQILENSGYDESTIAAVVNRRSGKTLPKRSGFFSGRSGR